MTVRRRTNLLWGLIALAAGAFAVVNALGLSLIHISEPTRH